jgi:putative SOS response-associated peptidase YedK
LKLARIVSDRDVKSRFVNENANPVFAEDRADIPSRAAAAIWDEWKDRATGERLKSCTMIITEPNEFAAEIHDRMPSILDGESIHALAKRGGEP